MTDIIYIPPPVVNIDTTAQTIGQWAQLSKDQLLKVAGSFAQQAAEHTTELWMWRISTISSLAVATLSFFGMGFANDQDTQGFCFIMLCGSGLWFLISCYGWSNVSSQIANANMWRTRALQML